jgi:dienelactone hydrolase
MPDESNVLPTSRVARWIAIAGLILFAVALYFRDGRRVPPVTGSAAAPAAPQPTP